MKTVGVVDPVGRAPGTKAFVVVSLKPWDRGAVARRHRDGISLAIHENKNTDFEPKTAPDGERADLVEDGGREQQGLSDPPEPNRKRCKPDGKARRSITTREAVGKIIG